MTALKETCTNPTLQKYDHQNTIFLGDFNAVCDPIINRRKVDSSSSHKGNKLTKFFHELSQILELKDIWRFRNPKEQGFTFHLSRHKSYLRTDMIWASIDLLTTQDIEILLKTFADHNLLLWTLRVKRHFNTWKFNSVLWKDINLKQKTANDLKNFFCNLNKGYMVWDTCKAYLEDLLFNTWLKGSKFILKYLLIYKSLNVNYKKIRPIRNLKNLIANSQHQLTFQRNSV